MKKLPYGISNYEELVTENYYYVDKTKYIEQLESLNDKTIMFLRPRKFGKTLFTSVLENYYDINKKDKFEKLFGNTYIGKHTTENKNKYHILKFNFAGIDTTTYETTINKFREKVEVSISRFKNTYGLDFYINSKQDSEDMLYSFFEAFRFQKPNQKLYVIIDEYDHFANELLGFNTKNFKELVSKNGKIRKWYEILKEGRESVVDRVFITGVAPITLDSLTSGFNIATDITTDEEFNNMMGFTAEEIKKMMEEQEISKKEQETLLPVMKENYDGYRFTEGIAEEIYNSNMCLYFLKQYIRYKMIPEKLVDVNIASDYSKIGNMLNLYEGDEKLEIIEKTITDEGITSEITQKFNPEIDFTKTELVSMLFYLGYLTITEKKLRGVKLNVPNNVIKEIYSEYFLKILDDRINLEVDKNYEEILEEIILHGKIEKLIELLHKYLNNLSNRDYQRFDEKYIKLIAYTIAMNMQVFRVKSELEVNRKYPDLLLIPKQNKSEYHSVIIEFKYLKSTDKNMLQEKQEEAKKQIQEYCEFEEIKGIENLDKYTIVAVNDELYVEKIK